jgi:CRP-like cAMP-binding protein
MANARFQAVGGAPRVTLPLDSSIADRMFLMSASALFAGLSKPECQAAAECARTRVLARSDMLFMQGQPIRQIMLIESGCVKLTQLSSNGSEVILWMRGSLEVIGLSGISTNCNHSCSARAVASGTALIWDWATIDRLANAHYQIRRNINAILSGQLNELEERFREVATEKVSRRVVFALVRLLPQVGKRTSGGIEISLSREELAQLTGTTLFTISRLISKWAELGVVEPRREAVLVLDPYRLSLISDEDG